MDERENALLQQIRLLNNNQTININSPKQVSMAIFGRIQSTSRQVLAMAASGQVTTLTPQQRQLASLVQTYRALVAHRRQPQSLRGITGTVGASGGTVGRDASVESGRNEPLRRSTDAAPTLPPTSEHAGDSLEMTEQDAFTSHPLRKLELSAHERQVHALFESPQSQLNPYWREPLLQLTRPTARTLVAQLDPTQCPMGFDPLATPSNAMAMGMDLGHREEASGTPAKTTTAGKKGSFLAYCRTQKEKYPDAIILTRCGDFYETYGLDAILLVEHCGLNAMAGKAKAGCPIRNVQATLDCLTRQGFRVAVYEEATDTDSSRGTAASGGSKSRIKNRFLAQIVSAASPTYLYDLVLLGNADLLGSTPPSRPYVGILSLDAGYTLVEVSVEEQSVRVMERMTAEAVACRLAAYPPADPLIYVPSMAEQQSNKLVASLPFLPSRLDYAETGPGARLRTQVVPPTLVEGIDVARSSLERAKNIILSALFKLTQIDDMASLDKQAARMNDFTLVNPAISSGCSKVTFTHSLHKETATQLGLMGDKAIPSLVAALVPESAPAATRRFLRRYLLTPPPPIVADAMRDLVSYLKIGGPALPPLSVPPIGKVLSLLRAGQASADVYRELIDTLQTTVSILETFSQQSNKSRLVESLMTLMEYECGMAALPDSVLMRCQEAMAVIGDIVWSGLPSENSSEALESFRISGDEAVPTAFFERNESPWRGRVRYETMPDAYDTVRQTATKLADAIREDFDPESSSVLQDIFNNILLLREIPKAATDKVMYIHPRDRFGKLIRNRYTTEKVQNALSSYVEACENAKNVVSTVLVGLSQKLHDEGHMPAIVQASHMNLIVSTAFHHAAKANILGWNTATMYEKDTTGHECAAHFVGLWPYWMDRSEAVSNSFNLDGMWILTAPNMSGKSTILRSTAAASLMVSCGLCAPVESGSSLRRFDHIFVRGASSDVPSENKSAFGAEMEDIAALLRSCGERSLVFVDELARGTSPRDGTVLAAAVLEEMAQRGMSGIFATHLHELLELPLMSSDRLRRKQMEIRKEYCNNTTNYRWTFHLGDGVCTDSLALETAERFGVPGKILARAEAFREQLTHAEKASSPTNTTRQLDYEGKVTIERQIREQVFDLVEQTAMRNATVIPANWMPPASLEGTSCVYVLSLNDQVSGEIRCYVGETDNLRKRIQQHRAKGEAWKMAEVIAIPMQEGKTEARALESQLIRSLANVGVDLVSTRDGRTIRHRNRLH